MLPLHGNSIKLACGRSTVSWPARMVGQGKAPLFPRSTLAHPPPPRPTCPQMLQAFGCHDGSRLNLWCSSMGKVRPWWLRQPSSPAAQRRDGLLPALALSATGCFKRTGLRVCGCNVGIHKQWLCAQRPWGSGTFSIRAAPRRMAPSLPAFLSGRALAWVGPRSSPGPGTPSRTRDSTANGPSTTGRSRLNRGTIILAAHEI